MNAQAARSILLLFALTTASAAQAATFIWQGPPGGAWSTPGNWSPAGPPSAGAAIIFFGAASVNLDINASVGTLANITGATLTMTGSSTLTITNAINWTADAMTISANVAVGTSSENWSFSGGSHAITGVVSGKLFNLVGAGTVTLSAANTFTGATMSSGTLRATTSTALGQGTIALSGGALTLDSSTGLTLPVTVTVTANSTLNLVSGGAESFTKSFTVLGGTTLAVTADSPSDSLTINTLTVNGTLTGPATLPLTVAPGTLSGTGTITPGVNVGAFAFFVPGTGGAGTLSTGPLSLSSSSNLNFNFSAPPTTTVAAVTGALTLSGTLNITNGGGLAFGSYPIFTATGGITNNVVVLGAAPAGFSYGIRKTANTVFIDVGRVPSAATLARYAGEHDGTASRLAWKSSQESKNLGFRVWREADGKRQLVTPGLIAGFALRAQVELAAGHTYGWEDRGAPNGGTYWIEAVDLKGQSEWTGPITTRQGTALRDVPTATLLTKASRAASLSVGPLMLGMPARQVGAGVSANREVQWQLAGMQAAKLLVHTQGFYHVPAEQLFTAGISPGTAVSSLSLWAAAQSVAFNVLSADGVHLQAGDAIEFYGVGLETDYTDTQVYWLTSGMGAGQRITTTTAQSLPKGGSSFLETLENRHPVTYSSLPNIALAARWLSSILLAGYGEVLSDERAFSTPLVDPLSSTPSTLTVAVQGLSLTPHNLSVLLNGTTIGKVSGTGVTLMTASFPLAAGLLTAGSKTIQLVPNGPAGAGPADISGLVYENLTYPRLYASGGGPLQFTATGPSGVSLSGLSPGTRVLDITDANHPLSLSAQMDAQSGALLVNIPAQGSRTLFAFQPLDVQRPDAVVANSPSHWHSAPAADLVIVAHESLLPSVQPLVSQREQEGLKVLAVDIQDIYDEFGNGEKSAGALKGFLQFASTSWGTPPAYVLLAGDGTYDPRGYLGHPEYDLVPALQVETSAMFTASDDAYVTFGGGTPDIAIGRLPLRTSADSVTAVTKILGRTLLSPSSSLLFVQGSQKYFTDGGVPFTSDDFGGDIARVKSVVSNWPSQQVGPLPDGGFDATVTAAVLSAIKSGPALVTYEGHGSEGTWSSGPSAEMLSSDVSSGDLQALAKTGTASVFLAGTCLNGYYLSPDSNTLVESLAEGLLRTEGGGAWAVWTSTGTTNATDHATFSAALVKAAVVDGKTLGEAMLLAKASEPDPDVRAVFHLFGDPSSRMAPPQAASLTTPGVQSRAAAGCGTPGASMTLLALLSLGTLLLFRRRHAPARTDRTRTRPR